MYPNLRYAFYDWTGLDAPALGLIQTYGFVLALCFLLSAWLLYKELKRRGDIGILQGVETTFYMGGPLSIFEILLNLLLGGLLGFKVVYAILHPKLFSDADANKYVFSLEHGSWIGAIAFAALFLAWKIWEKSREIDKYPVPEEITYFLMPKDRVLSIVILGAISGVLGAKMLHLAEFATLDNFMEILFSSGGLSIYGGLILGFFTILIYARWAKIPYLQLLDALAPILILAYGIGRLGCHLSGDGDWGKINPQPETRWLPNWLWAYSYPNNVLNEGTPMEFCSYPERFGDFCFELEQPVYPTPVWEFFICLFGFYLFAFLQKRLTTMGLLFAFYLIFNGIERFTIEIFRINPAYELLSGIALTQAQMIAIGFFICGLIASIYFSSKGKKLTIPPVPGSEEVTLPKSFQQEHPQQDGQDIPID